MTHRVVGSRTAGRLLPRTRLSRGTVSCTTPKDVEAVQGRAKSVYLDWVYMQLELPYDPRQFS